MSHFVVAVLSYDGDYDRLLAPYSESDEEYMTPEIIFDSREALEEAYENWKKRFNEEPSLRSSTTTTYNDAEEWVKNWEGFQDFGNNRWGYMANVSAKWDWYSEGGRWEGEFEKYLSHNASEDARKVKDYNVSIDKEAYADAEKFWDEYVMGANPENHKGYFYNPDYYKRNYGTKEVYANHCGIKCQPYAFVTADGEWIEPGEIGWFAISSSTPESMTAYDKAWMDYMNIKDNQELFINWIDCHI